MTKSSEQQEAIKLSDFVKDLQLSCQENGLHNLDVQCVIGHDGKISIRLNGNIRSCFGNDTLVEPRVGEKIPVGYDFTEVTKTKEYATNTREDGGLWSSQENR